MGTRNLYRLFKDPTFAGHIHCNKTVRYIRCLTCEYVLLGFVVSYRTRQFILDFREEINKR
jgi:hypothetical protein